MQLLLYTYNDLIHQSDDEFMSDKESTRMKDYEKTI